MSDDGWEWELATDAQEDLTAFTPEEQDRILDKLDEIVDSPWRDPPDYGEPLRNSPYKKVRVGGFSSFKAEPPASKSEGFRLVGSTSE